MSKVQLIHEGVSEIVGGPELGLLVLSDLTRTRQIAIVCDKHMEYELGLRAGEKSVTERLLPEVPCSVNPMMTSEHYGILFNSTAGGQYKALLVNEDDLTLTPIRASGAVLSAHVVKLNIFIEEHLFKHQSADSSISQNKMALPLNALSLEMLCHALRKTIGDENYEFASMLEDEIKSRAKEP